MFETATWTRSNRAHFDVVELMAQRAEVPIETEPEDAKTKQEVAYLAANRVGAIGVRSAITGFSMWGERSIGRRRHERRLYKAMTAESGLRASLLLTRGTARFLMRFGDAGAAKSLLALDRVVGSTFGSTPEDEAFIDELLGGTQRAQHDPELELVHMADRALTNASGVLELRALELAAGFEAARKLPQFKRLADVDWKVLLGDVQNAEWRLFMDLTGAARFDRRRDRAYGLADLLEADLG